MGERIKLLTPYQVTSAVMASAGNPRTKFMHCLPAFHNTETTVGAEMKEEFSIECMEITDHAGDPAFQNPTKFIGPVYTQEKAQMPAEAAGWRIAQGGEHWRRVAPSPRTQGHP